MYYQNNGTMNCGQTRSLHSTLSITVVSIQHLGERRLTSPQLIFTTPSLQNIPSFDFVRGTGRSTFGQQSATQTGSRMSGRWVDYNVCISKLWPFPAFITISLLGMVASIVMTGQKWPVPTKQNNTKPSKKPRQIKEEDIRERSLAFSCQSPRSFQENSLSSTPTLMKKTASTSPSQGPR